MAEYEEDYEVIDDEENYNRPAVATDTITPIIIILTTIFILLGISLVLWELVVVYDLKGDPQRSDSPLLK